ncbi:DsrE family protein [Shimia thalassica]|uniref:DsrE family protein n=1 Tax=Shimia thalassica TaxID=1715693 RepID=UPI0026E2CD08|nr:DsrE family protein [Shimia thalassica]MDO6799477.1 DsrE family protein [Shimia thalassica]MDP2518700.1 DsrE family protein [Shimia thalassica]
MRALLKNVVLVLAMVLGPMAALAEEGKPRLFVSLTTDDTWAAAKAIMFSHQKAQKQGHDAAIWMNVRAVYLADKKRPSHVHGLMAEQGTSIQDMLTAFIADGGTVIMCGACSKAAGLTKSDYIDGVTMGNTDLVASWLFDPNTKTLGW